MKRYLLDTSALLTLRDNEQGADGVAFILEQADIGAVLVYGSFITLMEVLYRVWKDEDEKAGRLAYEQVQSLSIEWVHENTKLLEQAAAIKAKYSLSLADAWIAATAQGQDAILVHKDPEFDSLEFIEKHALPYKK